MKKSIKYWSVFLLLITSLIISIPVYAQSTDPYQAIIDKLNEEYSMDMYFMEEDDPLFTEGILSSSRMRITMTPEEFEADLRQCIIENNRAKAEADRKMAELRTENIIETGSGSCSNSYSVSPRVVKRSEQSKKISGATAHLVANVKNDTGYWKFSELIRLYTSYTKGVDSTPGFSATRYQYNIIDAGRTYAFNLYGRTFTSSGVTSAFAPDMIMIELSLLLTVTHAIPVGVFSSGLRSIISMPKLSSVDKTPSPNESSPTLPMN